MNLETRPANPAKAVTEETMTTEEKLRKALDGLVARLDEMEGPLNDLATFRHVHGMPYTGPNWAEPMDEARAALALPVSESRVEWRVVYEYSIDGKNWAQCFGLPLPQERALLTQSHMKDRDQQYRDIVIESRTVATSPWTVQPVEGGKA